MFFSRQTCGHIRDDGYGEDPHTGCSRINYFRNSRHPDGIRTQSLKRADFGFCFIERSRDVSVYADLQFSEKSLIGNRCASEEFRIIEGIEGCIALRNDFIGKSVKRGVDVIFDEHETAGSIPGVHGTGGIAQEHLLDPQFCKEGYIKYDTIRRNGLVKMVSSGGHQNRCLSQAARQNLGTMASNRGAKVRERDDGSFAERGNSLLKPRTKHDSPAWFQYFTA